MSVDPNFTGLEGMTNGVNPFNRHDWTGRCISPDGTDTSDFKKHDVAGVVAAGASPSGWDGDVAAILVLKDGRYVAYQTFWGPTGDGFSADAYGGTADLTFTKTAEAASRWGLTDEGRRLCGLPQPDPLRHNQQLSEKES